MWTHMWSVFMHIELPWKNFLRADSVTPTTCMKYYLQYSCCIVPVDL